MKTLSRTVAALAAVALFGGAGTAALAQTAAAPASNAGCPDDVRHNATRESISYTYRGEEIPGLIYKPRYPNGVGVVLLHGFTGFAGHAPLFDPHAVQLASRGYTVLVPSYFDARPWRQRFGGQEIRTWSETAGEAVRFLGTQSGVDPQKVVLWGYSLGGYLATDGSLTDYGTAAAAVGISAGTDIYGNASRDTREIPILMMHGGSDRAVSQRSMLSLASNLRLRGARVETETLDGQQHELDAPTWCRVFERTRRFMETELSPVSTAPAPAA